MKTIPLNFLLYAVLMLSVFCMPLQAQNFTVNGKQINTDTLKRKIDSVLETSGIPAISLAVISNGQVVFSSAYGTKQIGTKEKVDRNTVFEGCSLSKSFLVFAAYRLIDEKKLDIDKPLYTYLEHPQLKYDERYKLITSRMVLNHSSGIENWKGMNDPDKLEILSTPGTRFIYSGEGYQYLAKVIETIQHKPYEDYIQELVYKPLHLKRTFSYYSKDGKYPADYAIGHDLFGKPLGKMKNQNAVPAGGNHFTAEDYARLIVATFDKQHLSKNRIDDILKPIVSLKEYSSVDYYYGQGYELQFNKGDTIISQGGSNPGFKAQVFYSVVSRNGIVFMTNSDRGKWIAEKLMALTAGLDIHPFYEQTYRQYPSKTIDLLHTYDLSNANNMFDEIDRLLKEKKLDDNTLNELSDIFRWNNVYTSRHLLEVNTASFPQSSKAFYLLGNICMDLKDYDTAYASYTKAKELKSDEHDLDQNIARCKELMEKKLAKDHLSK